ncbi:ARMT1-like domain-containing protein [uncultured Methanoregula sp.]|uniref:damage-control phosphatase ARMT1 family protein n=1 Tax=uncultured Methanoregula sp. TaxID=1005933 RepID=UPI002AAABA8A|nr:ARMT1-like domain-containing protein [uncultured Methanoregula sp.]
MKLTDTCIDCLLSRVVFECQLASADQDCTKKTLAVCRELLKSMKGSTLSHPQIASTVHRKACEMVGNRDPFFELKRIGNRQALSVCREVRGSLPTFHDRVLASVIGNTFDYAVRDHEVTTDFSRFFREEFNKGLEHNDTEKILPLCKRVVYLTDNCGEIVFDRLLIEYLKAHGSHVTVAVRDAPILNDATMEDALALGFDRFADHLTTTGAGAEIGIDLDKIPPDLAHAIETCTIILSKGMANYESLSGYDSLPPVAYLMCVKCKVIAEETGIARGSKIALLRP